MNTAAREINGGREVFFPLCAHTPLPSPLVCQGREAGQCGRWALLKTKTSLFPFSPQCFMKTPPGFVCWSLVVHQTRQLRGVFIIGKQVLGCEKLAPNPGKFPPRFLQKMRTGTKVVNDVAI